jgi:hypothetical protein
MRLYRSIHLRIRKSALTGFFIGIVLFGCLSIQTVQAQKVFQQPTGTIPTVTGTPIGIIATVKLEGEPQIKVRSGPGTNYKEIGFLLAGQVVPVKGKSSGGDWILIEFLGVAGNRGWVYSPYVTLTPGDLPIIEPPPTTTPRVTPTIDPTLAAQFIVTPIPTRLPTYTQVAPLVIPTYQDASTNSNPGGIPMGIIIFILASLGILVGVFSFFQNR